METRGDADIGHGYGERRSVMYTQSQLRAEIYNALIADSTLPDRIYWIARPTINNTFPLLIYSILDVDTGYFFNDGNIERGSEAFVVQIDLYVSTTDVTSMDSHIEAIKTVMEGLNYRKIDSGMEFYETDIDKLVRPTRWERYNV
jgi:hypothetical protein